MAVDIRNPVENVIDQAVYRSAQYVTPAASVSPGTTAVDGTQKAATVGTDGTIKTCGIVGVTPVGYIGSLGPFQMCKPTE